MVFMTEKVWRIYEEIRGGIKPRLVVNRLPW